MGRSGVSLIDRILRIVVADDHTLLRGILSDTLDAEPDLTVVAQVGNGAEAVAAAAEYEPDVVLLDLEMPGQGPLTTLRELYEICPDLRVLVLSADDHPDVIQDMINAGASGYLHKSVTRATLIAVIRALREADSQVTVAMSRKHHLDRKPEPVGACTGGLSSRELEVLEYVASALSNRQIAAKLNIAEGTVKRHMQNIFKKLGAVSRIDAVNRAVAAGLIEPT